VLNTDKSIRRDQQPPLSPFVKGEYGVVPFLKGRIMPCIQQKMLVGINPLDGERQGRET